MNLDLKGKRALVCGSSQGIGKAAAQELALMGAEICLLARNENSLKEVLTEIDSSSGQEHEYLVADFSKPAELKQVTDAYFAKGKWINILINNTGGPPGGIAIDADVEEFRIAFNNHLINNHQLAQACVPGMKASGYGRIVNVISTSVKAPLKGLGVSNTVRGAVANWSKTLANELGEFQITVNNVLPGATNTLRLESIVENKAAKSGKTIDEVSKAMAAQVPMQRVAEAYEVANAIAFLASPAASYINGINIPVDGGRTPNL